MSDESVVVRMSNIRKQFSGVSVLDDANFEVRKGEVHALAGGNGAGKSTLMKILQGVYSLDSGTVTINGEEFGSLSIDQAKNAGVGMVFQEFSLIPTMSVAENIFLGAETLTKSRMMNKSAMVDESQKIIDRIGIDLDPSTKMSRLSTGFWQLTEIAKALRANTSILILDEPTASLSAAETERFFELIKNLQREGISIIYISHRMEEIRKIANRITILRNGKNLITSDIQDISDEEIIDGIVGHHTESLSKTAHRKGPSGATLLQMKDVTSSNGIENVSLSVHEGEVVGLAGLMGAGRTEVTRVLFGIDRLTSGEIEIGGKKFMPKSPHDAIMRSIALVPEDRRKQGLVVSHSVKENLVLTRFKECMQLGLLSAKKISELALSLIESFSIKVDSPNAPASRLSGGNQQKIVIAKWLGMNPNLLIMDEPTAGIDIGTKQEVLAEVSSFAESGKGVLFISSELAEMVAVCDRYVLMKKGQVVGEVDASEISDEADLQLAIQHAGSLESR